MESPCAGITHIRFVRSEPSRFPLSPVHRAPVSLVIIAPRAFFGISAAPTQRVEASENQARMVLEDLEYRFSDSSLGSFPLGIVALTPQVCTADGQ